MIYRSASSFQSQVILPSQVNNYQNMINGSAEILLLSFISIELKGIFLLK